MKAAGASIVLGTPDRALDNNRMMQKLNDIDREYEKLRLDVLTQKENDKLRQEEMESFFKKASLEYFTKLKDVQEQFDRMRMDVMAQNNMVSKVQLLEQEVIDLKNQNKTRMFRIGAESEANIPSEGQMGDAVGKRINLVIEEINQLWSFTQRFIDEQAIDMIQEVRSPDRPLKSKMDRMEWLARNAEFLSPDQITKCLIAFKEHFNGQSVPARNSYITTNHNSLAIATVVNLLDHANKLNRDEESISRLAILLSILEPLLINN